jgi:uroporphyrinogen-III synthase/uroporphyrinogen III methyltransferase/synthase
MNRLPLAGRRILVTRAAQQAGKLSEGLRALGAEPVEVPVLEIQPPANYDAIDRALRAIQAYDWLILTSANAIPFIHVRAMDLDVTLLQLKPKIAAIGRATAQALETMLHVQASVTPKEYVAESLVCELAPQIAGKRVLLARAAIARDVIPDALRAAGATVDVIDAYRNVMPEAAPALLREALKKGIDAATFTSSSTVTHLAEAARAAGIDFPFANIAAISIGPVTSKTLREYGWEPAVEANPHDVPGLIDAANSALSLHRR